MTVLILKMEEFSMIKQEGVKTFQYKREKTICKKKKR